MKKRFMLMLGCAFVLATQAQVIKKDAAIEQKIEKMLGKMTLEEKIGQMCELNIDVLQDKSVKDRSPPSRRSR